MGGGERVGGGGRFEFGLQSVFPEPEVLSQSLRYSKLLISMPLTYSESCICPGSGMGE